MDKADRFNVGQVWKSPMGLLYRVVSVDSLGGAVLGHGISGSGEEVKLDFDAVINWVLYRDGDDR